MSECVPLCVDTLECKMRVDAFANVSECVFVSVGDCVDVPECTGVCERVCVFPDCLCVTTWTRVCVTVCR